MGAGGREGKGGSAVPVGTRAKQVSSRRSESVWRRTAGAGPSGAVATAAEGAKIARVKGLVNGW